MATISIIGSILSIVAMFVALGVAIDIRRQYAKLQEREDGGTGKHRKKMTTVYEDEHGKLEIEGPISDEKLRIMREKLQEERLKNSRYVRKGTPEWDKMMAHQEQMQEQMSQSATTEELPLPEEKPLVDLSVFGKPIARTYVADDYVNPLVCTHCHKPFIEGQSYYEIPLPADGPDSVLAVCMTDADRWFTQLRDERAGGEQDGQAPDHS